MYERYTEEELEEILQDWREDYYSSCGLVEELVDEIRHLYKVIDRLEGEK